MISHIFQVACLTALIAGIGGCNGEKSPEQLRAKGKALFGDEKYAEARDYFGKALKSNPSDRELLYLMGMAYRKDQMYDSALSCLRRVDLLYPNDQEINRNLYDVATALEDWAVARSALKGMIDLGAAPKHHWKIMADLWRRDDHPGNTYYFTKLALIDDPDDIDLWIQAANAAAVVDSGAAALAYIDTAIGRFGPKDMLIANQATFLTFVQKYDSAETILRGLLSKDTTSMQYRLNLAHVLSSQSSTAKKREALALYKSVAPTVSPEFKVDSLITALESKLK
jgi:tetratricopeptide (TPR) repeat protein